MAKGSFDIKSLRDDVLKNFSNNYKPGILERLSVLRRERIDKPLIMIGTGTCGLISGARQTLDSVMAYLNREGIDAEVVETGCNGYCSTAPHLSVQLPGKRRLSLNNLSHDKVDEVLDSIFNGFSPASNVLGQHRMPNLSHWENAPYIEDHAFFKYQQRHLLKQSGEIDPINIEEYIAYGGYKALTKVVYYYTSAELCDLIEESGLRGRSGSGFSTGKKWKIALNTPADTKYLICNADESDPGAFMERHLIEGNPHKIVEAVAIAAYAIGARTAYIYINSEYEVAIERIRHAIDQAISFGFVGENIFGSNFNLKIQIRKGAGALVCGEETALISSIEGRRGNPAIKPPYPAVKGLFGKPTVVNNVETLCNIPEIITQGPQWYRQTGTSLSPGTKIFSISGSTQRQGVVEVSMGTSFHQLVENIAGGVNSGHTLKAIQLGGTLGYCLTPAQLETTVDFEKTAEAGFSMGNGGLLVLDDTACMLDIAKFYMNHLQKESCGKCIPCREGTRRMLEILDSITRRPTNEAGYETLERFKGVMGLESLAQVIKETSLCGLGQNSPNPVLYTLKWFREEYEEHIFDRKCKAGVCKELRVFVIDVDKCTGCTLCLKKCPVNAIYGTQRNPHFIVENKCIGCGNCFDVCKFSAIYVK